MGLGHLMTILGDVFDWWSATIRACMPAWMRSGIGRARPKIVIQPSQIDISDAGQTRSIDLTDSDAVAQFKAACPPADCKQIPVALASGRYVVRELSPRRLPASRTRAMVDLDVAASTPFSVDGVYCFVLNCSDETKHRPTSYAIVKRSVLDPVVSLIGQSGGDISHLEFLPDTGGGGSRFFAARPDLARLNGNSRFAGKRFAIGLAVALLGSCATLLHVQWGYRQAQKAIEAEMPSLEARARSIRDRVDRRLKVIEQISALRHSLANQRPMTEVWEELSRVMPDSAYLTDMTVKGGNARVRGFAKSASAIIVPIEGSPVFEGAEFVASVVKAPGLEGERFEIKIGIPGR